MAGRITVAEYRAENIARLVKLEERQISIFKTLQRLEKNTDKINGQVQENKTNLTRISTVGSICVFVIPIVVSIIMRLL